MGSGALLRWTGLSELWAFVLLLRLEGNVKLTHDSC